MGKPSVPLSPVRRLAAALKDRFNRDFWVADGEYDALALDAEGGQVDALASNMGHLLWSGIADPARAEASATAHPTPESAPVITARELAAGRRA